MTSEAADAANKRVGGWGRRRGLWIFAPDDAIR